MAAWTDRVRSWWKERGGGTAGEARGVGQGSPDAIRVVAPDAGPIVAPMLHGDGLTDGLGAQLNLGTDLLSKYIDLELMDEYPPLSAVLDVYADDATVVDVQQRHAIWATGNDRLARELANDLLYRRLRVEEDLWSDVRTMSKYGNAPAEILAGEKGVVGLNYLPPASVRKVLDHRGQVLGYVQAVTTTGFSTVTSENFARLLKERGDGPNKDGVVVFAPWEVVWWEMPAKQTRAPYGESVLSAARWAWKRLIMLEDAAIQFRLTKAPSRFCVYVEVGHMPPNQQLKYLRDVKNQWKKRKVIDPATGQLDWRPSPAGLDEDLFIPVVDGREQSRVDVLQGADFNIIDDLEYFRGQMMSATRVPKNYINMGDEISRASLSQADVMFARTAMRVQRQFVRGVRQVQRLHFALLGVDPDETDVGFDMTVPSSVLEMSQIEAGNSRAALAAACADFYDRKTILVQVLGKSAAEAEAIIRARKADFAAQASMEGAAQVAMMGADAGVGNPEAQEAGQEPEADDAAEAAAVEALGRRLAQLVEDVERLGATARRTDENVRELPRRLARAARGRG